MFSMSVGIKCETQIAFSLIVIFFVTVNINEHLMTAHNVLVALGCLVNYVKIVVNIPN